MDTKLVEPQFN